MFSSLTNKLSSVFDKLSFKKHITESDIELAIREIRIALLEADVSLPVIKLLIEKIKEKAIGEKIIKGVNPTQQIIKIVNDEIILILGGKLDKDEEENYEIIKKDDLQIDKTKLNIILIAGLQGSGKTTSAVKLGKYLTDKKQAKVLLASSDIYRPFAREQLETFAKQNGLDTLSIIEDENPIDITKRALKSAKEGNYNVLIFDTAGRLQIDDSMMTEIKEISDILKANHNILVIDSMIGQEGLNVANTFKQAIPINGCILTKIDSDSRAGIALSLHAITNIPIKFLGTSEKADGLEVFYPDRIASRILGMGDVISLVEKAQEKIETAEAEKMAQKMFSGNFDLDDMLMQLKQMKKMGSLSGIMKFLPGMGRLQEQIKNSGLTDEVFKKQEAIILSMTKSERKNPSIIFASRKKRIASGSGTSISDVEKLLKQYEKSKQMMKQMQSMGGISGMMEMMKKMKDSGDLPNF